MTIPRNARAGCRALLLAAPAALLLLSACDSQGSAGSGSTAASQSEKAAPEVKTPAPPTTPVQAASHAGHDHAGHEGHGHDHAGHDHAGHDHAGHDHAGHAHHGHDHDHQIAFRAIDLAREQAELATRAAANAVADGAPASVQADLAARANTAQQLYKAALAAEPKPDVLRTHEGSRLFVPIGHERHDFGKLMAGAVSSHDFVLESQGNADLVIHQVKPTCGCTVARVMVEDADGEMREYAFGEPIPPGRKLIVPASLHTKGKRGRQNTSINITSSDPRGSTQLSLQADIEPFFVVEPQFLNFGQVEVGEVKTLEASISSARGQAVLLTLAEETLPGGAQVKLVPLNPDGEGRSVHWSMATTLGPDLVEGQVARALLIQSDQEVEGAEPDHLGKPQRYDLNITVSARVVGPFSHNPPFLALGLVRPGQVKNVVARIDCNDPDFDLSSADLNVRVVGMQQPGVEGYPEWEYASLFSTNLRPVEGQPNSLDLELTLEGLPEEAAGSIRGMLVLELGHPAKPEITWPITGVCRGGPGAPR